MTSYGGRLAGQKDITWEHANSTGMLPEQKAEELTYLSIISISP